MAVSVDKDARESSQYEWMIKNAGWNIEAMEESYAGGVRLVADLRGSR
jgi:hypothetical protein